MIQKYLRKGSFALAMAMVAAGCSHDLGDYSEEQMAIDHAQSTLGFYIPADQDWVMSSLVNANLPVEGLSGESYTVKVYSNNPLTDSVAYILDMKTVPAGGNYVSEFRYPTYMTSFYVGLTDSNGQTTYKMAMLNNGQITELISVSAARALTRAVPETSSHVNANANEWADPNKQYGGWLVPDPLTEGQKLRVQLYFQSHPNLTYEDPHWENFFVQQVYKGATNPSNSYSNTTEVVTAANGTTYKSGNMNLLTVGQSEVHINNFNDGNCSTSNVLDNGKTVNNGTYHSDQIMLMVNIDDTSCFGYHMTGSSIQRNDKAALVSAEVIDAWAAQNGNPGEAVVDKWNRSFIGFDLALFNLSEVTTDTPMKYQNAQTGNYAKINGEIVQINKSDNILYNGAPVYLISANTNQYGGTKKTISDGDFIKEYRYKDGNGAEQVDKYLDVDYINKLLADGYLPVKDSNLRDWVKVTDGSDGYYSDWIVTLCEAQRITPETPENPGNTSGSSKEEMQIWSYAFEDSNLKSDYDMNDVVIKVQETTNGTLKVMLVAAGCEYDNKVYLGDTLIRWDNDTEEVHDALGGTHGLTVNTGWHKGRDMATAEIAKPANYDPQTANWRIVPSGGDMEDKYIGVATTGSQPTGIVIPYDWEWPTERTNICDAYNRFSQWASSTTADGGDLRKASDWYKSPSGSVMK